MAISTGIARLLFVIVGIVVAVGVLRSAHGESGWILVLPPFDNAVIDAHSKLLDDVKRLGHPPSQNDAERILERARATLSNDQWEKFLRVWKLPSGLGGRRAVQTSEILVDSTAPLPQWTQIQAFDSARECEASRLRGVETARKELRGIEERDDPADLEVPRLKLIPFSTQVLASRCVPASALYAPQR